MKCKSIAMRLNITRKIVHLIFKFAAAVYLCAYTNFVVAQELGAISGVGPDGLEVFANQEGESIRFEVVNKSDIQVSIRTDFCFDHYNNVVVIAGPYFTDIRGHFSVGLGRLGPAKVLLSERGGTAECVLPYYFGPGTDYKSDHYIVWKMKLAKFKTNDPHSFDAFADVTHFGMLPLKGRMRSDEEVSRDFTP